MQRLFPTAVALVLFACGTAIAQVAFVPGVPTMRSMAPMGLTNPMHSVGAGRGVLEFRKPGPRNRGRCGQHHNMSNNRHGRLDNGLQHGFQRLAGDDNGHVGDRSAWDVQRWRALAAR
jgi:hypothetical protein